MSDLSDLSDLPNLSDLSDLSDTSDLSDLGRDYLIYLFYLIYLICLFHSWPLPCLFVLRAIHGGTTAVLTFFFSSASAGAALTSASRVIASRQMYIMHANVGVRCISQQGGIALSGFGGGVYSLSCVAVVV